MIQLKVNGVESSFDGDPNCRCCGICATYWA